MVMLEDYLSKVPDFRRAQGRRYPLNHILTMVILGLMSGRNGYRELATFMEGNADEFCELFNYENSKKMPSHVTVRNILQNIDYKEVIKAFQDWMSAVDASVVDRVISLDGKALRNTVTHSCEEEQNFVQTVHAFTQERKTAIGVKCFEQKKSHEGSVVRELIEELDLKNVIFTLDALHTQKNYRRN